MKLSDTVVLDKAIISHDQQSTKFSIKASAKSFEILSSGLYSNKIRAVIRELSCNAYDSHVEAGCKEKPFDMHLPTQLAPYFSIRDYGVGLSENEVAKIYTTYFESTKADSNDYIGALGLGSKSPFSYTKNFTITAIKNGMKGVYTAYIDDDGVPSLSRMRQCETDDPTGVEIKMSVESNDARRFISEAADVLMFFKVVPNFTGAGCEVKQPLTRVMENIIPGSHARKYGMNNGNIAVMGNIAYPISTNSLVTGASGDQFGAHFNLAAERKRQAAVAQLNNCGLELHFEIGEIEMAASREELSYTPSTINAIIDKYVAIYDILSVIVGNNIAKIDNTWDKIYYLQESIASRLVSTGAKAYIADNKDAFPFGKYTDILGTIQLNSTQMKNQFNISHRIMKMDRPHISSGYKFQPIATSAHEDHNRIVVGADILFVINNSNKNIGSQINYNYEKGEIPSRLTIVIVSRDKTDKDLDVEGFLKSVYGPPDAQVINANSLLTKPRNTRIKETNEVLVIATSDPDLNYGCRPTWGTEYIDKEDRSKKYYINLRGYTGIVKGNDVDPKMLNSLLQKILPKNNDFKHLYGIRKDVKNAINGLDNWIEISEYLDDLVGGFSDDEIANMMAAIAVGSEKGNLFTIAALDGIEDKNSQFVAFCKNSGKSKLVHKECGPMTFLRTLIGKPINQVKLQKKAVELGNALSDTYPLLSCLAPQCSTNYKAIAEYINLIDNANREKNNVISISNPRR
jgi:hypothetical protein